MSELLWTSVTRGRQPLGCGCVADLPGADGALRRCVLFAGVGWAPPDAQCRRGFDREPYSIQADVDQREDDGPLREGFAQRERGIEAFDGFDPYRFVLFTRDDEHSLLSGQGNPSLGLTAWQKRRDGNVARVTKW